MAAQMIVAHNAALQLEADLQQQEQQVQQKNGRQKPLSKSTSARQFIRRGSVTRDRNAQLTVEDPELFGEDLLQFLESHVQTRRALFGLFVRCCVVVFVSALFLIVRAQTTNRGFEVVVGNSLQSLASGASEVGDWNDLYSVLTNLVNNLFDADNEVHFQRIAVYNVFLGMTLTVWPGRGPENIPFGSENFPYKLSTCLETAVHGCEPPPIPMWQMGHHALKDAPVRYRSTGEPVSFPARCDGSNPYGEWDIFNQNAFDKLSHVALHSQSAMGHSSIRSGPYQSMPPRDRQMGNVTRSGALADLKWMQSSNFMNGNHTAVTLLVFMYNLAHGETSAASLQWIIREKDMTVDVDVLDQNGAIQFVANRHSATFCDIDPLHADIIARFPALCIFIFVFDICVTLWEIRRKFIPALSVSSTGKQSRMFADRQGIVHSHRNVLWQRLIGLVAPNDHSPALRGYLALVCQIVMFAVFLSTLEHANEFFNASSGAGDACGSDATVLQDCSSLSPSCGVQPCDGLTDDARTACCRRAMAYDSVMSVLSVSRTRQSLVVQAAFLIIALFCSVLTLLPRHNRLNVLYQSLQLSGVHLAHFIVGLLVIILGFAVAGTIMFSHHVDGFGSTWRGIIKLFAMLISGDLNTYNFESAYPFDGILAMAFYMTFGVISVLFMANVFIAILCEGFIGTNDQFQVLRSRPLWHDVKEFAFNTVQSTISKDASHRISQRQLQRKCLAFIKAKSEEAADGNVGIMLSALVPLVRECENGNVVNDQDAMDILRRTLRLPLEASHHHQMALPSSSSTQARHHRYGGFDQNDSGLRYRGGPADGVKNFHETNEDRARASNNNTDTLSETDTWLQWNEGADPQAGARMVEQSQSAVTRNNVNTLNANQHSPIISEALARPPTTFVHVADDDEVLHEVAC